MTLFPQILNKNQESLIKDISFLKFPPYYLSGGTALALQLGHRTSLDFDFDSKEKFDSKNLFVEAETISRTEDTIQVVVNGISLSIFYYPYKLIDNLVKFEGIQLAGLCDIAAMKVVAVIQRAKQRDFVDLYYLIKSLGLKKIIDSVYQKYPWYTDNSMIIFRSLIYFEEADSDSEAGRIIIFNSKVTWELVKFEIKTEVDKYLAQ